MHIFYIVACQAHPALVKIGPVFQYWYRLFIFDSLLARMCLVAALRTGGLLETPY